MGAYINALREEGTRADLLREIEKLLTERDRLRDALTPSAGTKAAYIGEFKFPIQTIDQDHRGDTMEFTRHITVPWDTVKEIMAAIRARAELKGIP